MAGPGVLAGHALTLALSQRERDRVRASHPSREQRGNSDTRRATERPDACDVTARPRDRPDPALLALAGCAPSRRRDRPRSRCRCCPRPAPGRCCAASRRPRSIDLEVYLLSHPQVIAALGSARARGVRTRVLLEPHPFGGGDNAAALRRAYGASASRRAGPARRSASPTPRRWSSTAPAWVMTANLTRAAFLSNREYLAAIAGRSRSPSWPALFEADWGRTALEPSRRGLVVSR